MQTERGEEELKQGEGDSERESEGGSIRLNLLNIQYEPKSVKMNNIVTFFFFTASANLRMFTA